MKILSKLLERWTARSALKQEYNDCVTLLGGCVDVRRDIRRGLWPASELEHTVRIENKTLARMHEIDVELNR